MSWTTDQAKNLSDQIFSFSRAPECELLLSLRRSGYTRFAANEVTTAGVTSDLRLQIQSRGDGRVGTVTVNDPTPAALERGVRLSEELMSNAPQDPEFSAGLPPQRYASIRAFHPRTSRLSPDERRRGVAAALETARAANLVASGFFEVTASYAAIANKKGNFAFFPSTEAAYSTTMRTANGTGSGWAAATAPLVGAIQPSRLAARAAAKAARSASPVKLPPGRYTAVLEPQAVADLVRASGSGLAARTVAEGRSYFSKLGGGSRLGERVFASSVTLRTDPFDPRVPGRPWTEERLPARATTWIEKGVLKALWVSRYWARKTGTRPLPISGAIVMDGGRGSVDQLVAGTKRGLLVTRFWYIRSVNPQTMQVTGLTRDGVWLIDDGEIVAPVNNFRFNESAANVLQNVEAMSAPRSTGTAVVPAIRTHEFNFTSASEAV